MDRPTDIATLLKKAQETGNYTPLMQAIPYALFMGVEMNIDAGGLPLFHLPFQQKNIGNAVLPAIHGGVIGGYLEHSAILHFMCARETTDLPKTVDFNIDYLRPGRPESVYAQCHVTRQGARVAHVQVDAWQNDRAKPIAVARVHFLL